jgi:hypothetical protein
LEPETQPSIGQQQRGWARGVCSWEQPSALAQHPPGENNLDHKFNMTVLTNTISAFIFGFRKGMMALPRNHY